MSKPNTPRPIDGLEPLSIDELETGLRVLKDARTERGLFWDENVAAFRVTVLSAIRETSDLLLTPTIPPRWRVELEAQLEDLVRYLALADRYVERRDLVPASSLRH